MDSLATRAHRKLRDSLPWAVRMDIKQHAKRYLRATCRDALPLRVEAMRRVCFLALRWL